MVAIPENKATEQDLQTWYVMQEQLRKLKDQEMALRKRIFKTYFPTPAEGTNKFDLPASYVLKGTYPIDRKVDVAALKAGAQLFAEKLIRVDLLVEWDPKLSISQYRKLTAEQIAVFDRCLIVKPGSPALEIVLPAKAKKEQA